jgi:phenylpropionate dioxygenase-like ring-hydroxylating dioxygenase large terminal subunit
MNDLDRYCAALEESLSKGRALGAECYRDASFFDLEAERVLRPGWHPVLRWDALPEPGDFVALDVASEPVVALRDTEGRLRVFSNVCRHRAHTIVEGAGHGRSLVCPYHRWSYGLDGTLRGAPIAADDPSFDRSACALPEIRSESWQGFLMVNLDSDAAPLAETLGELDARLEPYGLGDMLTVRVLEFDSPWNWKVMVENFMESYHHLGPHVESLHGSNPAQDTYCLDSDGPFTILENPGSGGAPSFVVVQVFPAFLFFAHDMGPFAGWYQMRIDRHDHFDLRIHVLAPPAVCETEGVADALCDAQTNVHLEDIPACEAVQRGIASRLWKPGGLIEQEAGLSRFHRDLAARLGG